MTEEQQGQFAEVRLSMYNWHVVLKILEEVCTMQDSAVRVYEAIATQLSEQPVHIIREPPVTRPRESPYEMQVIPPITLKGKVLAWLQHFR